MLDLEARLHDAAMGESASYQPSADLPERIGRRVRARRRRTRGLAGGALALGAGLVAVLALQLPGDDEQGVVLSDDPSSTTTTPSTTSTEPSPTTTAAVVALDETTPLTATGVGPIGVGMTIAEAESATGLRFSTSEMMVRFPYCSTVRLDSQPDLVIWALPPGGSGILAGEADGTDPRDFVIRQIYISDLDPGAVSARRTMTGVGLGSTEMEVREAHGGAIEDKPHERAADGLYVHPADTPGFGIRYTLDDSRVVTSIHVGEAALLTASPSCL